MPMIMCAAGKHFYNPDIHGECPSCKEDGVPQDDFSGRQEPSVKTNVFDNSLAGTDATPKTTAMENESTAKTTVKKDVDEQVPKTSVKDFNDNSSEQIESEPVESPATPQAPASVPPAGTSKTDSGATLKTRVFMGDTNATTDEHYPVVGWLVVMQGKGKGHDFRLIQGENRIGRGEDMEVCLDFGLDSDDTVSRDAHAIVVYDSNSNEFFVERGNSRNLPLLNGSTIRRDQNLSPGDIIRLGDTELQFIAFCNDKFKW